MRRKQPIRLKRYRPGRRDCFDWGRCWLVSALFALLVLLALLLVYLISGETPKEILINAWPQSAPATPVEITPAA